LNRGVIFGSFGGFIIFLVLFTFISYSSSDFDQSLVDRVGIVPSDQLILEIDSETLKEDSNAKKRLDSHVMNSNDWGKGDLVTENDYTYNIEIYHKEMGFIAEYDKVRKDFVKGQISKQEFLDDAHSIKEKLNMISFG
jgi:hypothetical protein